VYDERDQINKQRVTKVAQSSCVPAHAAEVRAPPPSNEAKQKKEKPQKVQQKKNVKLEGLLRQSLKNWRRHTKKK
jgi:hypothetical protein